MEVALLSPLFPQNTGNIARSCVATNSKLLLVPPLGFSLSEKQVQRAGLDYWQHLEYQIEPYFIEYLEKQKRPFYFFSSKASVEYHTISYTKDDLLIFGNEVEGIAQQYHTCWPERFVKIPQSLKVRCLNLSNAVAIVLYEAWRQQNFCDI